MNNALGRTMSFTIQCRILRSFLSRLRHLSAAIASVTYLLSCEESLSCDITTSIYIHPSHSVTTTNIFIDPSHSETTTNIFIRPSHSLSQQQISSYILLTLCHNNKYLHTSFSLSVTTNIFIYPSHSLSKTTNIFTHPSHSLSQQQISSYILLTLSQQQIYSSFTNITVHF